MEQRTLQRMLAVEYEVRRRQQSAQTLGDFARAHAASAPLQFGKAASACAMRYTDRGMKDLTDFGPRSFAYCVLTYTLEDLLGRDGARKRGAVPLSWYANAGPDDRVDFGCDGPVDGFYHRHSDSICLHEELRGNRLVEVVAHEACHAAKHRTKKVDAAVEEEAIAYGLKIADRWGLPPQEQCHDMSVCPLGHPMPTTALPDAIVLDCRSARIYRNDGTLREPRWSVLTQL